MLIFKGFSGRIALWFMAVFLFVAFVGWDQLRDITLIHDKVIKMEQMNHQSHDLHALEINIRSTLDVVRNYLITGSASAATDFQQAHRNLQYALDQTRANNIDVAEITRAIDAISVLANKIFALPFSTGNMEGPILMREIDEQLSALSLLLSDQHHDMDGIVNQSMHMVSGLHLDMRYDLMLSLILLFALLLGMSIYFYVHMIHPLILLRREVARIGEGDFAPLSLELGDNELGELSSALNSMGQALMHRSAELEQAKSLAAHHEKMHALGLMTASIAHEVGNPLTATSVQLDLARHKLAKGQHGAVAKSLDEAVLELRRTEMIITNILDFGHRSSHDEESVHIKKVINSAVQLVRLASNSDSIQVVVSVPKGIPCAWGNVDMLRQVLVNLLLNAMDACRVQGTVSVEVHVATACIFIDVVDQGAGVPDDMRENIFSPLFSTKAKGKGTGLGLSISRDLMRKMLGDLELMESGAEGCRFRLSIPVAQEGDDADIDC